MSLLSSPMPFRLDVLEQNVVSDSDQIAQRPNADRGLPQDHLDIAARQFIHLIRRIKQALDYVGHWLLLTWAASVALRRFAFEITLSVTWFALMIAAATWMRFGMFPWEMM